MATKKTPKSTKAGDIFDVAKPGRNGLPASSTSRAIITPNRSVMRDPMMADDEPTTAPEVTPSASPAKTSSKIVITPLHDVSEIKSETTETPVAEPAAEPTPSAETTTSEAEPNTDPATQPPIAPASTPELPAKDEVNVKAPADEPSEAPVAPKPPEGFPQPTPDAAAKPEDTPGVPETPEQREADNELARKHAARLQKMIDEEEYFLPIKTIEQRRSRKVAVIGLLIIILLAAVWYDAAIDAGLLPNTYNLPHTSFFSVK